MKKFWLACTMIIAMGVSSCVDSDKDLYQEDPGTGTNPSSFSNVQKVQVEIDYSDSESRVPFSIYDGNPLIEGENTIALKENVQALDGAWTDEQGKFTATVDLPIKGVMLPNKTKIMVNTTLPRSATTSVKRTVETD